MQAGLRNDVPPGLFPTRRASMEASRSRCVVSEEEVARDAVLRARGERLRAAASRVGIMRAAKEAGVPYTTLRDVMGHGDGKLSVIAALAQVCGVSIDWIAHGDGAEPGDAPPPPLPDTGGLDWLAQRLGAARDELVAFHASGDAMSPTLRDGDLVVARRDPGRLAAPGIYAVEIDGMPAARRLERRPDGSVLVATDNPLYENYTLTPDRASALPVIGPVVWQAGPIRG